MADQTLDVRFELLLRQALAAEVASIPLTVTPALVLERAASRKRRQHMGWRALLGRPEMPRFAPALAGAAVLVLAVALALGFLANRQGIGVLPSPSPSASPTVTASPSVQTSSAPGYMWPQATLGEVRAAQELADAGDRTYAWQLRVDAGQLGQHHPCAGAAIGCWSREGRFGGKGEIFNRFLEEELGWVDYFWEETLSHSGIEGLDPGDVVFVRCAAGVANPLYPPDPESPGCAPTIDELRYERVKINVAQPDRQGPTGIWVVTGWEMIEPAVQVAPPSDAEIDASVGAFLQARIDGEGAEGFADFVRDDPFASERINPEIPLLYATSTGAPYERSEFELVDGPVWPSGWMQFEVRLFAANDETVVEQIFSLERDGTDRLRLVYDFKPTVSSVQVPATTENGQSVPVEYAFLDGVVTYRATYPLEPSQDGFRALDRLAVEGHLPGDSGPRRLLVFLADPQPIGPGCVAAPAPTDAEALARSIGADPNFEVTSSGAVTIGGLSAMQIDLLLAPGVSCGTILKPHPLEPGRFVGHRARLYLVDLPGGSAQVLAIAIGADDDSFNTVLEWAAPVVESIEFHAP